MLKYILLFVHLVVSPCFLMAEKKINGEIPCFALITIPKSGSHLIMKALYLLTDSVPVWHTRFPSLFYLKPKDGFLYTHFCLSPELESDYAALPAMKKIICIRDLRDVAVSIVSHIRKNLWPGLSLEMREEFLKLSFDEQLLFVINFDYDVQEVADYAPNSLQVSLAKIGQQSMRYTYDPANLTCRYEDLVGEQGGGSNEAQKREVERLALFLKISIDPCDIEDIAGKLYGNETEIYGKGSMMNFRSTFTKGQIGNWKNVFKEEHKDAFKKKLGKYLIALGYEDNNLW